MDRHQPLVVYSIAQAIVCGWLAIRQYIDSGMMCTCLPKGITISHLVEYLIACVLINDIVSDGLPSLLHIRINGVYISAILTLPRCLVHLQSNRMDCHQSFG